MSKTYENAIQDVSQEITRLERVKTKQAAMELNMDIETLHWQMQKGKLPIGFVKKKDKATRYSYYIYRGALDKYKQKLAGGQDLVELGENK